MIFGIITLALLSCFIIQLATGPLGSRPAPDWLIGLLAGLFILITINFRQITLTLTEEGIRVRYGVFASARSWKDIVRCEKDEKHYFYGWGVRLGRYKKQWVWVYNVMGGPRLVFITDKRKPTGLIVSTKNPDEVLKIAAGQKTAR